MNSPPNREVALFSAALELAASQRAAYLDGACADDPALRQRLAALLRVHDEAVPFLETPPGAHGRPPAEVPALTVCASDSPAEKAGDRIGRYKLLQQIGEGGCGVVYMAEQEEPVRRRVALKVIKLGMDTKQVVARFEAERQALALMDHPNIAKVFDAGATETGRPYFVMELVRGSKITDFCDQNNLSTQDRLKLFIQVCQAIQHAHQKGIIHRDIKPSNILVTVSEPGAPGCPKVIDFGIAKATSGQRLTDMTVFTAFEQFIGTPAYMSPEQAMMTSLDIDTRTDIYALGVLLYELLTGTTPFDTKALLAAGLDEIRRTIREVEPVKPSTRLTQVQGARVGGSGKSAIRNPQSAIDADLDWIVMKALEKDRARRYETANGLATDIQRHLNCEPVAARPPSRLYEFQKTVRRHKLGFAAGAALVTVLAVGALVSTLEAIRATRAERDQSRLRRAAQQAQANEARLRQEAQTDQKKAETEAAKSQHVAHLLENMLAGVGPSVALGRDTMLLREILDRTAERIGTELKDQPEVEAELRSIIGDTYLQLSELDKAEAMEREALRLRKSVFGETNLLLAASLNDLARVLARRGQSVNDLSEAEAAVRQALTARRRLLGNEHPEVAGSAALLAGVLLREGNLTEAEAASREVLALRRKLLGPEHQDVASSLDNLGLILRQEGRLPEAEAAIKEALAIQRKLVNASIDVSTSLNYLAGVLQRQGRLADAEAAYRETLTRRKKLYGDANPYTASVLSALIAVLRAQGKLGDVETLYREVLAGQRAALGNDSPVVVETLSSLAASLNAQGKQAEAEKASREAMEIIPKLGDQGVAKLPPVIRQLAEALKSQGKLGDVETLYREVLAGQRAALGNDSPVVVETLSSLAASLNAQGKQAEAEKASREAMEIIPKLGDQGVAKLPPVVRRLAEALKSQGKAQDSEKLFEDTISLAQQKLGETNLILGELRHDYAGFLEGEAKWEASAAQYINSLPIRRATQNDGLAWTLRNLGGVLVLIGRPQEAEGYLRESLALYRKLHHQEHITGTAWASHKLAYALYLQHKLPEAEQAYRDALAAYTKCHAMDRDDYAGAVRSLLGVLKEENKLADGEALCRQILLQQRAAFTNDNLAVATALSSLAASLYAQDKQAEAEKASREAMEIVLKLHAQERAKLPSSVRQLAEDLKLQDKSRDAEKLYEAAINLARQKLGETNAVLGDLLHDYGDFLEHEDKIEAALNYHLKSLPILRTHPDDNLVWALRNLGDELVWLGRLHEAEAYYREAPAVYRNLHHQEDVNGTAWICKVLGDALYQQHKLPEAEQAYREALAAYTKCHALSSDGYAGVVQSLMGVLKEENKLAEGEGLCREILAQQRAAFTNDDRVAAQTLSPLADNLASQGKQAEAETTLREAIHVFQQSVGRNASRSDERAKLGHLQWQLGQMLAVRHQAAEAEQVFLEAFQVFEKASREFPRESYIRQEEAYTALLLAGMLECEGRFDSAEGEYRHAIALHQKGSADFPSEAVFTERLGTLKVRLVELLLRRGKLAEARSMYREAAEHADPQTLNALAWQLATGSDPKLRDGPSAVTLAEKAAVATKRKNAGYLDTLAAAYAEAGQFTNAVRIQQEAIALLQTEQEKMDYASRLKLYENNSPYRDHGALAELASARLREGKFAEAEGPARECLALREREIPDDWRTFNARSMLGGSLVGQKKCTEAEPLLLSGYEGMKQRENGIPAAGKPRLKETLQRLVQLYEATNRPGQLAQWKHKLALFNGEEAEGQTAAAPKP